jgi:FlaA1/EpsC-like NDP-sugar epimerase
MEDHMALFKRQKRELPPLISDEELFPSVDYDSVLEWLLGLSAKEYSQVLEVANIHRDAYQKSAAVLGKPNEATTFIDDPKDELQTQPAFIIDKEQKAPKQIKVKE